MVNLQQVAMEDTEQRYWLKTSFLLLAKEMLILLSLVI